MLFHGLLGDPKLLRDLFVGVPLDQAPDHSPPARRQAKPRAGLRHGDRLPRGDPIEHDDNTCLIHISGTRDSKTANEHGGGQVVHHAADMKALAIFEVRDRKNTFGEVVAQVNHLGRKNTPGHVSQTSLVYLGTELGGLLIHIQQLPLVREDNDTRVRAFFAGGLN